MKLKAELSIADIKEAITAHVESALDGKVIPNGVTLHISTGGNSPVEHDTVSATVAYDKNISAKFVPPQL